MFHRHVDYDWNMRTRRIYSIAKKESQPIFIDVSLFIYMYVSCISICIAEESGRYIGQKLIFTGILAFIRK